MGKQARRIGYGTWETPGEELVQESVRTQSAMTYIGRRQATVAQWVAIRPIVEVFAEEKGYDGGRPIFFGIFVENSHPH